MADIKNISKITLPVGDSFVTYEIKDAVAREAISKINSFEYKICDAAANTPAGAVHGEITGTLAASADTLACIYLVPSVNGTKDVYDEYITIKKADNTYIWEMFGNTDVHMSDLGALAKKDDASASYKPAGTVSQPAFTGAEGDLSVKGTAAGAISVGSGTANYTPAGTVAASFTGAAMESTGNFTPAGSIVVGAGDANYTPAGALEGGAISVSLTTADQYVASSATSGGSVTDGQAAQCTLPTMNMSVADATETLTLEFVAGSFTANVPTAVTMPTFTATTVASAVSEAKISTLPTFKGTGAELKFNGTQGDVSVTGTTTGSVTDLGFTGTGVELKFTGSETEATGKFTPAGEVSQPTFDGTTATITVS